MRGGAGAKRSPPAVPVVSIEEPSSLIDGKYRVLDRIGEGAMGVVYAGVHELTGREVALKLIARRGLPASQLRMRLLREARACGRIAHRNVLEILDVGQTQAGDPFLVMPLLRGETLRSRMRRQLCLSPIEAAGIMAQVAHGLAAAHAAGVIHRDLKPGNVFLHTEADRDEPRVLVLDFGLSKLTTSDEHSNTTIGSTLGSLGYMSPEQVRSDRVVDHRADIWTLGVVFYEAVAGTRPFPATEPVRFMTEVLSGRIPNLADAVSGVDPRLVHVVSGCLQRDPQKRLDSALEIAALLEAVVEDAKHFDGDQTLRAPLCRPGMDAEGDAPTILFQRPDELRKVVATMGEPARGAVVSPLPAPSPLPPLRPPRAAPFVTGLAVGAGLALLGALLSSSPRDAPPVPLAHGASRIWSLTQAGFACARTAAEAARPIPAEPPPAKGEPARRPGGPAPGGSGPPPTARTVPELPLDPG